MLEWEEILYLINLRQEGGYWDFKKEWYKTDSKGKQDLLHDIICMANNIDGRDAYIIIGVDEEKDYDLIDVSSNKGRKNTQKLVDFLKDKKFAGGIRPTVYVNSFNISRKILDIIVIKNDNNTPYYLTEKINGIRANYIYTRIQDTNTPVDKSADIDKVELLWKKRFGLTQSPLDRFEIYLEEYKNWIDGPHGGMKIYYKYFPEFTIECKSAEDERDGYEYYLFSQVDSRPHWYDIKFKYHQTLLMEFCGIFLDGGRYFTPCPDIDGITLDETKKYCWDFSYKYFIKDTLKYKLNEFFFFKDEFSDEFARKKLFEVILLFESEYEHMKFKEYARKNWDKRESYLKGVCIPDIPNFSQYKERAFVEEYENALVLNKMLKEFRNLKS